MKFKLHLLILFSVVGSYTTSAQLIGVIASSHKVSSETKSDPDAEAFKMATGITGSNAAAIDSLVTWLKDSALWDSKNVIYPIIGGTASAHSYNLIDATKFKLSFSGTWSHTTTGMRPSSAFAKTGWVPSAEGGGSLLGSIGVYVRTNGDGDFVDVGAANSNNGQFLIWPSLYNTTYGAINSTGTYRYDPSGGGLGWSFSNRGSADGSVDNYTQRDLSQQERVYFAYQNSIVNVELYIGAKNNAGTATAHSNREIAFVFFSSNPLSTAKALTLYRIIQKYQTLLSRQL